MSQTKSTMVPSVVNKTPTATPGESKTLQAQPNPEHVAEQPHRPTHWWVWLIVIVVTAAAVASIFWLVKLNTTRAENDAAMKKAKHATPVVVAKATEGDLQIYLTGLGTVTPLATVNLHTRVDGQILHVRFKEGQLVKAGDILLEIDPAPYRAALHQAQGQLAKDKATDDNAKSIVTMDSQAEAENKGAIAQNVVVADKFTETAAAASMEADNAAIEAAQVNVDYCTVRSPVDGRIGLRKVDEGNIVHAADTTALAVIAELSPISVVFTLPEDDIGRIEKQIAFSDQTKNPVEVLAFDRNLNKQLAAGTLEALDSQIDPTSGTLAIKAIFDNKNRELFPNQFVNARLQVEKLINVLMIPSAAIQPGNGTSGPYVYIVKDLKAVKDPSGGGEHTEGTVHMQPVKTGASQPAIRPGEEDRTVVTSGLSAGDTVVVDGVDKLIEGAPVTVPSPKSTTRPAGGASRDNTTDIGESPTSGAAADLEPTTVPTGTPAAHPGGRGRKPKSE